MKTKSLAVAALLASAATASHAFDSASFEVATGQGSQIARVAGQWNWGVKWFDSNGTHLGGYWDLSLARWRNNNYQGRDARQNITDVGITPVFRFQANNQRGLYGEAGVGAHDLSDLYDSGDRKLSTRFQFGDHIGVGYVLGNGVDLGIRLQHFSNGGITEPNSGVNLIVFRAAYSF
jgi:hypothetical protein